MPSIPKLDRYRYISELGRGGMSHVVLAEDVLLGRRVALKRMNAGDDAGALLRLRREALIGASISHPNLVSIYDIVAAAGGEYVIVMEYVDGQTLREALAGGTRLPVTEALRILECVAAGLDAIHAEGIVHRDVKPANILLAADGQVKLADLGIAAAPDRTRITAEGVILGTLGYVAPESLEGKPATPATDIYALGVLAYEVLSGRKARSEPNAVALAHAIVTRPPPNLQDAWPEAPAAAAELLKRALAVDPALRPKSATELTRSLRDALRTPDTRPLRARAAPVPERKNAQRAERVAGAGVAATAATARRAVAPAPGPVRARPVAVDRSLRQQPRRPEPRRPPPGRERVTGEERRRRGPVLAALLGMLLVAAVVAILIDQSTSGHTPAPVRAHRAQTHRSAASGGHHKPAAPARSSSSPGSGGSGGSGSAAAAASSSTPSASGSTVTAASDTPIAAAERFYTLAAAHRYAEAWALADPTFRSQLEGYASFENGQALDRSITFDSARVVSQTATTAMLEVRTTSVRADGTQHCGGTIQLERSGSAWLLHQIGINCT